MNTATVSTSEDSVFSRFFYYVMNNGYTKVTYPESWNGKRSERAIISLGAERLEKFEAGGGIIPNIGRGSRHKMICKLVTQEERDYIYGLDKFLTEKFGGTEYQHYKENQSVSAWKKEFDTKWHQSGKTIPPEYLAN